MKRKIKNIVPPAGHPRLMLLSEDIEVVRANLHISENKLAYDLWMELCEAPITGKGATPEYGSYNLREYLAVEARAFRALLDQDNKGYAEEAIEALFCLLENFEIKGGIMGARWGGHLIFVSSQIYDWCYRYLTFEEKEKIINCCEKIASDYFEMGYPPVHQTALSGHGCEAQLLRDLLSFSIAVYDERPDIYDFCAGRILDEYVMTNAFHFSGNSHLQGPTYGAYRYVWTLWAAMLFKSMSGQKIFDENLESVADYFLYMLRPDGELFRMGDDCIEKKGKWLLESPIVASMFMAGAYTGRARYMKYVKQNLKRSHMLPDKHGMDFYEIASDGEGAFSPVVMLLWNRFQNGDQSDEAVMKYRYFPYPMGMTIWKNDETGTAILMKIGELWGANHDHLDTGCFQIYHKGILASDSGIYDSYNTSHRKNYLIRTSAHNCITVQDPNRPGDVWEAVDGGVRRPMNGKEPRNIFEWEQHYRMAKVLSHYESDTLCEITGDLTEAYSATCNSVVRTMRFDASKGYGKLTVTDQIRAKDASYIKTFHIHTQNEPIVRDNEIVITNKQGYLSCKIIEPKNPQILIVGGNEKAFCVEGINYPPEKDSLMTDEKMQQLEPGWDR